MRARVFLQALILSGIVSVGVPGPASASSPAPHVSISVSSHTPERSQKFIGSACWSGAKMGEIIQLEVGVGTKLRWRPIQRSRVTTVSGCVSWKLSGGSFGPHQYVEQVLEAGRVIAKSRVAHIVTYGQISVNTFFQSVLGCTNTGTVSTVTNVYPYICSFRTGGYSASSQNVHNFQSKSTCRSLTVTVVGTDNSNGDPNSQGTETLQLIQSATNPQTVSFSDNQLVTETFTLDGSQGNFQDWSTGAQPFYAQNTIFFLAKGTADCSSISGV